MNSHVQEKVQLLSCCYACKTVYSIIPIPSKNFHRVKRALHELAVQFTEFRNAVQESKQFALSYITDLKHAADPADMISTGCDRSQMVVENLYRAVTKVLECARRVMVSMSERINGKKYDTYMATFVGFRVVDLITVVEMETKNLLSVFANLTLHVTMLEITMQEE
ncbi:hypothetical protein TTRE_0000007801 [Trichuris trichiura]|uniref:Uncharacterized protein n=1 Tax=Trichuris trichiura TaxID=36087 RepID=A0A077YVP2_TRITR|nr:hypothetical protein TTRE_0000007801 [Trichuris trichiura]